MQDETPIMMTERASLDIIADDRGTPVQQPPQQAEAENDVEDAQPVPEDSRSTSSMSSPVPVDNEESDFFHGANDSQSSLGVPNLQDMQVYDDECRPPINRLPNEILIAIFVKLNSPTDILKVMLTCKRWARNAVDILWHRPSCTTWDRHRSICQTLGLEQPYFTYRDFIKRLNLASLADKVNDGSVMPLSVCSRVERLTLTNCKGLTDTGLIALVQNNSHLLALDISMDDQISEASINAIADNCKRLQGLNVSHCRMISNESMVKLAQNCRYIKRLKLNHCEQINNEAVIAFAENCPNILEIDLQQCTCLTNEPITRLLTKGQSLRELRLANCELIDDGAFLSLPYDMTFENLRILDLTFCQRLTDRAVEKIVDAAPRLRNLVLAKCRNLTDASAYAISKLGKNLHFLHMGHCIHLTDDAVKRLVKYCTRIRYIDLGCCSNLTDDSVMRLAELPKLKRIGLVKCASITDESVYALAKANKRARPRRDAGGNIIPGEHYSSHSSLERVHLSYCVNLTLKSIVELLNACPRLTHLSLTGVQAFLREDLEAFCRDAPPEFTDLQRSVFCVFSGQGVVSLRKYLNSERAFAGSIPAEPRHAPIFNHGPPTVSHLHNPDGGFDNVDADAADDDDGLDDGTEMVIDTNDMQPLLNHNAGVQIGNDMVPPPPPPPPPHGMTANPFGYVGGHHPYVPQQVQFHNGLPIHQSSVPPHVEVQEDDDDDDMEEFIILGPANGGASTATLSSSNTIVPPGTTTSASTAGPSLVETGASNASPQGAASPANLSTGPSTHDDFVQIHYSEGSPSNGSGSS
ncbi:SCF E3 ubiquitin ligase complex F-box protein grrA [Rhypophila decipiens]